MFEIKKLQSLNKISKRLYDCAIICFEDKLKENKDGFSELYEENKYNEKIIENANKNINYCLSSGNFGGKSKLFMGDNIDNYKNAEEISDEEKCNILSDLYSCVFCIKVYDTFLKTGKKKSKNKNSDAIINNIKNNIKCEDIINTITKNINKRIIELSQEQE